MRKYVFILLATVVSLIAVGRTIKLEYLQFDKDLKQLADFAGYDLMKIQLTSDTAGAEYDLIAVTVMPDSVSEELISTVIPVKLHKDTVEWNVIAQPLGSDSVKIGVPGTGYKPTVSHIPTNMKILMECQAQSEFNGNEEIPLFAYTRGKEFEAEWNGKKVKAYQFCEVRQSGKHPSQWGKMFNLPPYVYYVLRPRKD